MNFLSQTKLTRKEWDNIEKPIDNEKEKIVLNMINNSFNDLNMKKNIIISLNIFLKIDKKYDNVIFNKIIYDKLCEINKKKVINVHKNNEKIKINKVDSMKIENSIKKINQVNNESTEKIIEFLIIDEIKKLIKCILKHKDDYSSNKKFIISFFNIKLYLNLHNDIINKELVDICNEIIDKYINEIKIDSFLENINTLVENNHIYSTKKIELYKHQKQIFDFFVNKNNNNGSFVWYCAPTSSGKTLTPIGLCNKYRVIFMCASKHIGLGLAKSAFSCGKKIGFAFGCSQMEDIRLNYNAINNYIIKKNGRKVPDHSDGTKVELMICDIKSYEIAMIYMKAYNKVNNIILFWDEPTIGLDMPEHYLHNNISKNWSLNQIPNVVLSCATLPKINEVENVITNFSNKFDNVEFKCIDVFDQVSNVMLYDINGNIVMPHNYFKEYNKMVDFLEYQHEKYYKLYNCKECCKFILFYNKYFDNDFVELNFKNIDDINMNHIKETYYSCLMSIGSQDKWEIIQNKYFKKYTMKETTDNSDFNYIGPELTSYSAKSLTNGPTLYITNQIENISKYLLSKSGITSEVLNNIQKKISFNQNINNILIDKTKDYEDKIEKFKDNEKIMIDQRFPDDVIQLQREIEKLQNNIKPLSLDAVYRPNTKNHFDKWNKNLNIEYHESDVYCGKIEEDDIKIVSQLSTMYNVYKVLMLMGVGIFTNNTLCNEEKFTDKQLMKEETSQYVEIVKRMAEEKSLYLIMANSDYIYGTNYQFSHCYLGKDMKGISQEKIIQCIGRIGRQEKNKHFSFRFRNNEHIETLFSIPEKNIEAENMNKLFK